VASACTPRGPPPLYQPLLAHSCHHEKKTFVIAIPPLQQLQPLLYFSSSPAAALIVFSLYALDPQWLGTCSWLLPPLHAGLIPPVRCQPKKRSKQSWKKGHALKMASIQSRHECTVSTQSQKNPAARHLESIFSTRMWYRSRKSLVEASIPLSCNAQSCIKVRAWVITAFHVVSVWLPGGHPSLSRWVDPQMPSTLQVQVAGSRLSPEIWASDNKEYRCKHT